MLICKATGLPVVFHVCRTLIMGWLRVPVTVPFAIKTPEVSMSAAWFKMRPAVDALVFIVMTAPLLLVGAIMAAWTTSLKLLPVAGHGPTPTAPSEYMANLDENVPTSAGSGLRAASDTAFVTV